MYTEIGYTERKIFYIIIKYMYTHGEILRDFRALLQQKVHT